MSTRTWTLALILILVTTAGCFGSDGEPGPESSEDSFQMAGAGGWPSSPGEGQPGTPPGTEGESGQEGSGGTGDPGSPDTVGGSEPNGGSGPGSGSEDPSSSGEEKPRGSDRSGFIPGIIALPPGTPPTWDPLQDLGSIVTGTGAEVDVAGYRFSGSTVDDLGRDTEFTLEIAVGDVSSQGIEYTLISEERFQEYVERGGTPLGPDLPEGTPMVSDPIRSRTLETRFTIIQDATGQYQPGDQVTMTGWIPIDQGMPQDWWPFARVEVQDPHGGGVWAYYPGAEEARTVQDAAGTPLPRGEWARQAAEETVDDTDDVDGTSISGGGEGTIPDPEDLPPLPLDQVESPMVPVPYAAGGWSEGSLLEVMLSLYFVDAYAAFPSEGTLPVDATDGVIVDKAGEILGPIGSGEGGYGVWPGLIGPLGDDPGLSLPGFWVSYSVQGPDGTYAFALSIAPGMAFPASVEVDTPHQQVQLEVDGIDLSVLPV